MDEVGITYPCRWEYKVIGTAEEAVRLAIAEVVAEAEHTVSLSRTSAGGKYCSLRVEVLVHDEETRLAIGNGLGAHAAVRIVI